MKRITVLIFVSIINFQSCVTKAYKINGLSFVAANEAIKPRHVSPVIATHANYVAIMPFGYLKDINKPSLDYNLQTQWFGETKAGVRQYIEELRKKHLKIMLKPQIWVWQGHFTGLIEMHTEEDWQILENTYSTFILDYAKLAQDLNLEIFCMGTELEKFIENRPKFWMALIPKIKRVYTGKITYAANWDEYKKTPFWSALDYIGIDAYFPISDKKTPDLQDCLMALASHKSKVQNVSATYKKPILFTEFGYRSVDYSGRKPWASSSAMTQVNLEAQTNCMRALFETFWNENWFAGGFVWKWHHNHENAGGLNNSRFTPQNKPSQDVITHFYGL